MKKILLITVGVITLFSLCSSPVMAKNNTNIINNELFIVDTVGKDVTPITKQDKALINKARDLSFVCQYKYSDKKFYLEKYKEIDEKYLDVLERKEYIYDKHSDEELDLLFRLVEAEATGGNFDDKCNIASVVFNRTLDSEFPDGITEVINQQHYGIPQFSPIKDGRIDKVEVTEDTILACEYVFLFGDTTNGALYFDKCQSSWASKQMEYIMTDDIGHSYYKKGE